MVEPLILFKSHMLIIFLQAWSSVLPDDGVRYGIDILIRKC